MEVSLYQFSLLARSIRQRKNQMNYKQHPLSAAFPAMQPDEYQALVDSVLEVGILNPITIYDGMVIDGWHRYSAANEAGINCPSVDLGDVDPRDFVLAQNKARRNLTASQRADAVVKVYLWRASNAGRPRGEVTSPLAKTNAQLAAIAGTTTRTIQQAKAVHVSGVKAVQDAVKTGVVSVETAAAVSKLPAKEQKKISAKGPDAMRAAAKPLPVIHDSEGAPDEAEFNSIDAAEKAEADAMRVLLASDAPLADVTEKYKQALLQISMLEARIVGMQNQSAHQIKTIKGLQKKLERMEQPA